MLYQRSPWSPPRDLFNWFLGSALAAALLILMAMAGGSWDRAYGIARREAGIFERCRPYSSAAEAMELLGQPVNRVCEGNLERLRYDQVDGLPGGAELWIRDGRVVRLFSLETPQHRAAFEQARASRLR